MNTTAGETGAVDDLASGTDAFLFIAIILLFVGLIR